MDEERDAAKKLLQDLMKRHPNASESELFQLFKDAAKDDEEVVRVMAEFWVKRRDMH
jgi:hypothetical protein